MGIIAPKKPDEASKVLITAFLIILSPLLIIAGLLYLSWGLILYFAIWLRGKKQFVIFVYSDSPTWKDYIEKEILPHIQDRAVILNWSERRNWKNSLPILAFRYFSGHKNFNPIGLVFHPFQLVKTYRFYEAFKEFKHRNPRKVKEIQSELFRILKVQKTS